MSLGLTLISAFSGMITAISLYFSGQVSLVEGIGAYAITGLMVALIAALILVLDNQNSENHA